jgi:predicted CXXCH cytochrome family protein
VVKDKVLVWCWKHFKWLVLLLSWFVLSLVILTYYGSPFFLQNSDKTKLLPGAMINGHYQIGKNCNACHTPFKGVPQDTCLNCHAEELKAVNDSHSVSKFKDPRNAAKLSKINALECVTCHDDHKPEFVNKLGVTVEDRFCIYCHENISEDRPSHANFNFENCRQCHNYHDNKALYEDFVKKHLDEPKILKKTTYLEKNFSEVYPKLFPFSNNTLTAEKHDGPKDSDQKFVQEWVNSSHAKSGVNCKNCHAPENQEWNIKPGVETCNKCHLLETKGFLESRHGMRLNQKNLSPMKPKLARLAMKKDSLEKELKCNSCHGAHKYKTNLAEVKACLECHADEHSVSYKNSKHMKLWNSKKKSNGKGVSCAGCHFSRKEIKTGGIKRILVNHNQNSTLRPNQKMVRPVCMNCHGLGFSLDALGDIKLVNNNFSESPENHIKIIEIVKKRINQKEP